MVGYLFRHLVFIILLCAAISISDRWNMVFEGAHRRCPVQIGLWTNALVSCRVVSTACLGEVGVMAFLPNYLNNLASKGLVADPE